MPRLDTRAPAPASSTLVIDHTTTGRQKHALRLLTGAHRALGARLPTAPAAPVRVPCARLLANPRNLSVRGVGTRGRRALSRWPQTPC